MDIVVWGILIIGAFIGLAWFTSDKQTDESLAEEAARAKEGLDAETYRELTDLLSRKKKIEAIKRLREKTGVGLYTAKQVVEGL